MNQDVSRNKNSSEKNSDFFLKPQPICVCFVSKGQKKGRLAGSLSCYHTRAFLSAGIQSSCRKNGTISGQMDDPYCVGRVEEMDDEFFLWVKQAYRFAESK